MDSQKFEMIFKEPTPLSESEYPGFNPRTEKAKGMIIEYDVAVQMRDGVKIYIDLFRPDTEEKCPAILAWGPWQTGAEHNLFNDREHRIRR